MKQSTKLRLFWDTESNGLLDKATKIHVMVIRDLDSQQKWVCRGDHVPTTDGTLSLAEGFKLLNSAAEVWSHNGIDFDHPLILKLHGQQIRTKVRDSLVCVRVIWTDIEESDYKRPDFPRKLAGRHSLEAWGHRLGKLKGDFGKASAEEGESVWDNWSQEMEDYCVQDCEVGVALVHAIWRAAYSETCLDLEHEFAEIISRMTRHGVGFDEAKARHLWGTMAERQQMLIFRLKEDFPPQEVEYFTPKKQIRKTKMVEFNPTSRPQIARRLQELGWEPTKFTETKQVTIDDEVLAEVAKTIPQAEPLAELFLLEKRLGYLATGAKAVMGYLKDGRVHGRVNTNKAVTGRCGHSEPNLAQVPRVGSPYGAEFRELFIPTETGFKLIGADASGLELRCLAHYLAPYDGGAYIQLVTEGDVHTFNQGVFGLAPGKPGRNNAKTGIYAVVYGAGDEQFGWSLGPLAPEHEAAAQKLEVPANVIARAKKYNEEWTEDRAVNFRRGMYARARMRAHLTGYGELVDAVLTTVFGPVVSVSARGFRVRDAKQGRGYLIGIDGRRLHVRSEHAALNTLLQSCGAVIVKMATVIWERMCTEQALGHQLLLHVHDEIQAQGPAENAARIGSTFKDAIVEAGRVLKFRTPLGSEFAVGNNWKETH